MTFHEKLQQDLEALQEISNELQNDRESASPQFNEMRGKTRSFMEMLQRYMSAPYLLKGDRKERWNAAFDEMVKAVDLYFEDHDQIVHIQSKGRRRYAVCNRLRDLCRNIKTDMRTVSTAMKMADNFREHIEKGEYEVNIRRLSDYLSSRKELSPADCMNPAKTGFTGTPSDEFFGNMLQAAEQEFALHESGENIPVERTIYRDAFMNMSRSLREASEAEQMAFARLLEFRRLDLMDRLAASLQRYQIKHDTDQAQGLPAESVKAMLYKDPDYRKLESLALLDDMLGPGAQAFSENLHNTEAWKNRASVRALKDYRPQILKHDLEADPNREQIFQERKESDKELISGTNYENVPPNIHILFEIYRSMMADTEDASPSFDAMRRHLGKFLDQDHVHIADLTAYESLLTAASETAENYLNTHRAKSFYLHSYGAERRNQADAVRRACDQVRNGPDGLNRKIALAREEMNTALHRKPQNEAGLYQQVELLRMSRVHNLTSTKFVRAERAQNLAQTGLSHFFGTVFHGISSGIAALSAVAAWGPIKLSRLFSGKRKEAENHDYYRIPGLRTKERFKPVLPDKKPADQPIISDPRRVPLVWEQKIAGDPNQPPTISIYSYQAVEGKARANGSGMDGAGHAFMALEYTRKNPLTGKLQRYRTRFGFHPRQQDSAVLMAGSAIKGYTQPGVLRNNVDYLSQAGITFQANNRQINKIIVASQNYARGGYNMVTRNCTTFVKDMAEIAGLDTKDLFFETDFEAGFLGTSAVGAGLLTGNILHEVSKHVLKQEAQQKNTTDYLLIGQQRADEKEIQDLEKSQLNMRMRGYNPSRLVEAIKASGRANCTSASSSRHADNLPTDATINMRYMETVQKLNDKTERELRSFCRRHGLNETEVIKQFTPLMMVDAQKLILSLGDGFFVGLTGEETALDVYKRNEENLKRSGEALAQIQKNIDTFYRTVLHSDRELYSVFENLTSAFQKYRDAVDERLSTLDTVFAVEQENLHGLDSLKELIDQNREDADALYEYRFKSLDIHVDGNHDLGAGEGGRVSLTIPQAAASAVTGSETYAEDVYRNAQLMEHKNNLTRAQKKELEMLETRMEVSNAAAHSMEYYVNSETFTKGDLDFLFNQLPDSREGASAASVFQAFAWRHVLGKTRQNIKERVNAFSAEHEELLRQSLKDDAGEEERAEYWEKTLTCLEEFSDRCFEIAAEAMKNPSPEFRMILTTIVQNAERKTAVFPENDSERISFRKNVLTKAVNDLADSMVNSVFQKQICGAMDQYEKQHGFKMPEWVRSMDGLKNRMKECLQYAIAGGDPELADLKNPDPLNDAEKQQRDKAASGITWIAEEMSGTPGVMNVTAEIYPSFRKLRNEISGLPQRGTGRRDQDQERDGAEKVLADAKSAARDLLINASLGRESLSKADSKEIVTQAAKLTLVLFMNKLSDRDRKTLVQKIGREPRSYDRYIARISANREFLQLFSEPGVMQPNELCKKENMRNFLNRVDGILTSEFSRNVHINNTMITEAAEEPQNRNQDELQRII